MAKCDYCHQKDKIEGQRFCSEECFYGWIYYGDNKEGGVFGAPYVGLEIREPAPTIPPPKEGEKG